MHLHWRALPAAVLCMPVHEGSCHARGSRVNIYLDDSPRPRSRAGSFRSRAGSFRRLGSCRRSFRQPRARYFRPLAISPGLRGSRRHSRF